MTKRNKRHLAVAVATIWTVLTAQATNYYWQEDIGSGEWSDTAMWSPNGVPGIYDVAYFTNPQSAPFTLSFANDASARLSLGSTDAAKPVMATFDLNGHTLTHTNSTLHANRALDWTILNGTLWSHTTAGALNIGNNETNYVPKVTVGAGANYLHNGTTYIQVGSRSAGELVIRDGGKLITQVSDGTSGLRMGTTTYAGYTNYTAKMTVTGSGSVWSNLVGEVVLSGNAKAKAELNVTDNGRFVHTGGLFSLGHVAGANASLTIASGGVVDIRQALGYLCIGNLGTGTVTVTGTGSSLLAVTNQSLFFGNQADTATGTMIIEKGGLVDKMVGNDSIYLGNRDNAVGRLIIRDGGLLRWAGQVGKVNVGGRGAAEGSIGELTVTGADSRAIIGECVIGQNCGNALVTVAGGGTLEVFRRMYMGRINAGLGSHNGSVKLIVTGTGSVLKKSALTIDELPDANMNTTISLGVGGGGFQGWDDSGMLYEVGYGPGGKGLAVIENGGRVEINGAVAVYSNSTLRIDGGRAQSGTIGMETNAVFNAALRLGDANGTALMTASGEVRIWGATLALEKGSDFASFPGDVYTLIAADALHSAINRFSCGGSILQDGDIVEVGGTTFKIGYTANAITLTVRNNGTLIRVL